MDQDLVSYAISEALQSGCEYAEARYQKTSDVTCLLRNGVAEPATMSDAEGIGVRVVYDGALAFGATNRLTRQEVKVIVERIVRHAKAASSSLKERVALLKDIDRGFQSPIAGVSFPNRMLFLGWSIDEKYYENSDGSKLQGRVPRAAYFCILTSVYDGRPRTVSVPAGYSQLGGSGGWEVIEKLNLSETIPAGAKEITAGIKATERPPTDEVMDVILGPNVASLTSHESCGHPGEADRILGREGAQAGESFLKSDKLGMQIGSPEAFVSDDPTIPHSMGFYKYDDEGVKARKRKLIDGGRFTEFLHNRATAKVFNINSNGSSRAVQFDREPIIRMANTFIEAGDWTF